MPRQRIAFVVALALVLVATTGAVTAKKQKKKRAAQRADPYAEHVWPPPPDEPRIKLETVLTGRVDVEAPSRWKKILLGATPQSPYDRLQKPFAVAFDNTGRIVVTDWESAALIRFDLQERRMDVLGTQGALRLKQPLGLDIAADDTIYVADAALKSVVAFSPEGRFSGAWGRAGELENPTDAALSPDGKSLFVADSKAHRIVVFDLASGSTTFSFGERGEGEGDFAFPTSLTFGPEGNLFVVDQINSRVQVFAADGEYLDQFGRLGVGFANFVRPKDIAVDEVGLIYVTDNAFNNVQLFDADFTLLTFVGEGGFGPGRFNGASGIAVQGDRFAVVDQLGRRVQVFRFIVPREKPVAPVRVAVRPEESAAPPSPPTRTEALPVTSEAVPSSSAKTPVPSGEEVEIPAEEQIAVSEIDEGVEPKAPLPVRDEAPRELSESQKAATKTAEPEPSPAESARPPSLFSVVEAWRQAWADQRVEDYLSFYSSDFRSDSGLSRQAWRAQRRFRLTRPRFIDLSIDELQEQFREPDRASATFVQSYRSDLFQDRVKKTLVFVLENRQWRIVEERVEEVFE